jgi:hypothetical protein
VSGLQTGKPSKTYGEGRICWHCRTQRLSKYNPNDVCWVCQDKQDHWESCLLYDADGWPMNLTPIDIRILVLAIASPCEYLPLTTIISDIPESTVKSSVAKLNKCGWIFKSKRGLGTALVAEPIKGRRRE